MAPLNHTSETRATVAASLVSTVVAFALSRGMALEEIEVESGVSALDLMNHEARISDDVLPRLWAAVAGRYPDAPLSIELARAAPLTSLAGLAHGAQFAEDLGQALTLLIDHRSIIADRLQLELQPSDDEAAFVMVHPLDRKDGSERAAEAGAALVWRMVTDVLDIRGCLLRVELLYTGQGPRDAYERFFGAPVRFEQSRNSLVFRRESLGWPTSQANGQLFAFVREYFAQALRRLEGSSELRDVAVLREAIVDNAARGEFSASAAAARAKLSLRVAQRQAAQHGHSLSGLIDEVREGCAREFLADRSIAIETVAALVGYSDDRAFRRAFKRWTGLSPSEFRRKRGGGERSPEGPSSES